MRQTAPSAITMEHLTPGDSGRIVSLNGGSGFQRKLLALGLGPGQRFRLVRGGRGCSVCVQVAGSELVLGGGMARKIVVHPLQMHS